MSKKDLLGTLILSLGVLVGLLLLKQSQEYREKAQWPEKNTYTLCHRTYFDEQPWVEIQVSEEELQEHLVHGDIIGSCPSSPTPTGSLVTLPVSPTLRIVTMTPTLKIPTPTPIPTLAPQEEEEKAVEIISTGPATLTFKIRFQSVDSKKPDQTVRVELLSKEGERKTYESVLLSADSNGLYSGVLADINSGVHDILIKGDSHLQKKFSNIMVYSGKNIYDWSNHELLAGDFNQDNKITLSDIASLLFLYTAEDSVVRLENLNYDINFDGLINISDINCVVGNYTDLEVFGEG